MESQRSYSFGGDDDGGRGSGGCVRGTLQAIVLSGLSFNNKSILFGIIQNSPLVWFNRKMFMFSQYVFKYGQ